MIPPFARLSRYFHTLRHLRPVQVYGRLLRKATQLIPAPPLPGKVSIDTPESAWHIPPLRHPLWTGGAELDLLGERVDTSRGDFWKAASLSALQRYNLHYFEEPGGELSAPAQAFYRELIRSWLASNPVGGAGWSAYPLSRRVANWIKADLGYGLLDDAARASLFQQAGYLRPRLECHLQGNHLWCNAKALVFAGLYFGARRGNRVAAGWLRDGMALLRREFHEQIRADGSHYEQSAMYQALMLEDLLDLINLLTAYNEPVPGEWWPGLRRMLAFTQSFSHRDGSPVAFNDATAGVAPTRDELFAYAALLRTGLVPDGAPRDLFPDAGWARLDAGPWTLFFDAGAIGPDHLPAHAHADSLTVEVDLDGERFLVDTGVSEYGSSPVRQWQRGTAAHNTVCVDGQDSSEVWAGFRVARRARIRKPLDCVTETEQTRCTATHDGYRRLPGSITHCREIRLSAGQLVIIDTLEGSGHHFVDMHWYLSSSVDTNRRDNGTLSLVPAPCNPDGPVRHITVSAVARTASAAATTLELSTEAATYGLCFGRTAASQRLRGRLETSEFPMSVTTTFTLADHTTTRAGES